VRYDIRWEEKCLEDLAEIYGDMETADLATAGSIWALSRAPLHRLTWEIAPGSSFRLTWVKPFLDFPAVAMSYSIVIDGINQYCLMHRARRANVAGAS
jgi:hypothetical protein